MGKHTTKPSKTTEIIPFVPEKLNEVSFAEIKGRHVISDNSNLQRITKGEHYFHHVKSGFNYTYNGFADEKHICLVDPKTRQNVKVDEKNFLKEFKFAGPATVKKSSRK